MAARTTNILKKYGLTLQQEEFCQFFTSEGEFFGNGTQSYIEAYDIDTSKRGQYDCAKAGAYKLLTKVYISRRINDLLEKSGLNAEHVDKRLLYWVNQSADGAVSMRAIEQFNKLKQRITDKVEHTIVPVSGMKITVVAPKK